MPTQEVRGERRERSETLKSAVEIARVAHVTQTRNALLMRVCVYACMHIYVCVYIYIYACVCMYIYVFVCMYIYMWKSEDILVNDGSQQLSL